MLTYSRGTGLGYIYIYIVDFLLVTDATENVGVQDVAVRGHELLLYSYNAVKYSGSVLQGHLVPSSL